MVEDAHREKEMWMAVIYCELLQEGESKSHIQLNYNNEHSINVGHISINRIDLNTCKDKENTTWVSKVKNASTHFLPLYFSAATARFFLKAWI